MSSPLLVHLDVARETLYATDFVLKISISFIQFTLQMYRPYTFINKPMIQHASYKTLRAYSFLSVQCYCIIYLWLSFMI